VRRYFCDRCGEECASSIIHLHLNEEHYTNNHELAGVDDYAGLELCRPCGDALQDWFAARGRTWPARRTEMEMEQPLYAEDRRAHLPMIEADRP
jgi:NMD protein affecting ribosome stability and mRNA decay